MDGPAPSPASPPHPSVVDRLTLADWRRSVSALYAEVRAIADRDPAAAHARWREVREQLFRHHPQSPLPVDRRPGFVASYWPYDPRLRFRLTVEPAGEPARADGAAPPLALAGADALRFDRFGFVTVPLPEGERRLSVFWMTGYSGGLFLPFGDATNGAETYGAGRYVLDGAKGADLGGDAAAATIVVDFNFAFQPSCAWDPRWACPLAPPENRLDLPVRAGERLS